MLTFPWGKRVPPTWLIQAGLIGFLGGLVFAYFGADVSLQSLLIAFLLAPLLVRAKPAAVLAALILGLNLGLWRGAFVAQDLAQYNRLYDQKVSVLGRVVDDSAYADRGQLEFHISDVRLIDDEDTLHELPGRVRVRGFGVASIRRGDVVEVSGKLFEGFGNRQGSISFADVTVLAREGHWLEDIRARYFAGIYTALPEPQASLGLGFLVGTRTLLPENLLDQLSATGLTHIVAVSGYNLTILVRLTRRMFAEKSKYLATFSSVGLIVGFLAVTGFSPSITRAAVVSAFALTAWYYGRTLKPVMLLLLAAAITAGVNPTYLWLDIGWYLSFLAFFGVLVIAPLITKRLFKDKKPKLFAQLAIETTSAQLMALPLIVVIFGELSLISLLANVIILPLIPIAMLLTFFAGLGGMFMPAIAGWIAWPANVLLTFMTEMIALLARAPWALAELDMSWHQLAAFYGVVLFVTFVLARRIKVRLNAAEVIE